MDFKYLKWIELVLPEWLRALVCLRDYWILIAWVAFVLPEWLFDLPEWHLLSLSGDCLVFGGPDLRKRVLNTSCLKYELQCLSGLSRETYFIESITNEVRALYIDWNWTIAFVSSTRALIENITVDPLRSRSCALKYLFDPILPHTNSSGVWYYL